MEIHLDKKVNGYTFKKDLTEKDLLNAKFKKNKIRGKISYYYCTRLDKEITLNITIKKEELDACKLDVIQNIDILDENFLQIYTCFYNSANNHFKFLDKIIDSYNNEMNRLVNLGILNKEENCQQDLLKSK